MALPPFKDKSEVLPMTGASPLLPVSTACSLAPTISSYFSTEFMAILFKTAITENSAFAMIDAALVSGCSYDGYFNAVSDAGETTLSWAPSMSAGEFLEQVKEMLRLTWDAARFWIIYDRHEVREDPDVTEMRNAAFRLTRGYNGVIVASLSLLGRQDTEHDLELVFVCFADDFQRRNFRVRYEGKAITN